MRVVLATYDFTTISTPTDIYGQSRDHRPSARPGERVGIFIARAFMDRNGGPIMFYSNCGYQHLFSEREECMRVFENTE